MNHQLLISNLNTKNRISSIARKMTLTQKTQLVDYGDFSDSEEEKCDHAQKPWKSRANKTIPRKNRTSSTVSMPPIKSSNSTYRLVDYDADSEGEDEPIYESKVAFTVLPGNVGPIMKKSYVFFRHIEEKAFEDDQFLPPKKKMCFRNESKQGIPSRNFDIPQHLVDQLLKSLTFSFG